jgi:hypothetical protein
MDSKISSDSESSESPIPTRDEDPPESARIVDTNGSTPGHIIEAEEVCEVSDKPDDPEAIQVLEILSTQERPSANEHLGNCSLMGLLIWDKDTDTDPCSLAQTGCGGYTRGHEPPQTSKELSGNK